MNCSLNWSYISSGQLHCRIVSALWLSQDCFLDNDKLNKAFRFFNFLQSLQRRKEERLSYISPRPLPQPPPPRSLWLAPFPLFWSFNMALSRAKHSCAQRKRMHCRLVLHGRESLFRRVSCSAVAFVQQRKAVVISRMIVTCPGLNLEVIEAFFCEFKADFLRLICETFAASNQPWGLYTVKSHNNNIMALDTVQCNEQRQN